MQPWTVFLQLCWLIFKSDFPCLQPCTLPCPSYSSTARKLKKPSCLLFLPFFWRKSTHFSRPCLSLCGRDTCIDQTLWSTWFPSNIWGNLEKWQGKVASLLGSYLWLAGITVHQELGRGCGYTPCLVHSPLSLHKASFSHVLCSLDCSETFQLSMLIMKWKAK